MRRSPKMVDLAGFIKNNPPSLPATKTTPPQTKTSTQRGPRGPPREPIRVPGTNIPLTPLNKYIYYYRRWYQAQYDIQHEQKEKNPEQDIIGKFIEQRDKLKTQYMNAKTEYDKNPEQKHYIPELKMKAERSVLNRESEIDFFKKEIIERFKYVTVDDIIKSKLRTTTPELLYSGSGRRTSRKKRKRKSRKRKKRKTKRKKTRRKRKTKKNR